MWKVISQLCSIYLISSSGHVQRVLYLRTKRWTTSCMAAILLGVSLKEVVQIAHFSASALHVALEWRIGKGVLRMWLKKRKARLWAVNVTKTHLVCSDLPAWKQHLCSAVSKNDVLQVFAGHMPKVSFVTFLHRRSALCHLQFDIL